MIVIIKDFVKMLNVYVYLDSEASPAKKKVALILALIMAYAIKMENVNVIKVSREKTAPSNSALTTALTTEFAKITNAFVKEDLLAQIVNNNNAPIAAITTEFVARAHVIVTSGSSESTAVFNYVKTNVHLKAVATTANASV
jgi:hypothetical protein